MVSFKYELCVYLVSEKRNEHYMYDSLDG